MAPLVSIFFLLCVSLTPAFQGFASADEIITVKLGETATLPCKAPSNGVAVDWSRDNITVCFYRGSKSQCETDYLPLFFKDRVELKDPQMTDGDASLVLHNVTVNDSGTYECRVSKKRTKRSLVLEDDPINSIILKVDPGHCVGQNCSGKDGGDEGKGEKDGEKRGRYGFIAAGIFFLLVMVVVIYKKCNTTSEHSYQQPPADEAAHSSV